MWNTQQCVIMKCQKPLVLSPVSCVLLPGSTSGINYNIPDYNFHSFKAPSKILELIPT